MLPLPGCYNGLNFLKSFSNEVDPEIQELIQAAEGGENSDTSSDVALARMLQMQFDKEHNEMLKAQEKQYNGSNKGKTQYSCICLYNGYWIFCF